MKTPRYSRARKLGIDMTPMIDVVFLLIIFFLVSSHLAKQETQLDLPLPIAKSGENADSRQTPRVTLNVTEAGQILMAGREIDSSALPMRLVQLRETEGNDLEVRIRGSRDSAYAFFEPIMLSCTEAGIWNVTFAVFERETRQ
ncbi:MAG: biopolymer transporter ExbD [Pirellulaceae bacterium]